MGGVLSRLRKLHVMEVDPWDGSKWCYECSAEWPCDTIKIIDGDEDELVRVDRDAVGGLRHSLRPALGGGWLYTLYSHSGHSIANGKATTEAGAWDAINSAAIVYRKGLEE